MEDTSPCYVRGVARNLNKKEIHFLKNAHWALSQAKSMHFERSGLKNIRSDQSKSSVIHEERSLKSPHPYLGAGKSVRVATPTNLYPHSSHQVAPPHSPSSLEPRFGIYNNYKKGQRESKGPLGGRDLSGPGQPSSKIAFSCVKLHFFHFRGLNVC